jgi:hypothetical protein
MYKCNHLQIFQSKIVDKYVFNKTYNISFYLFLYGKSWVIGDLPEFSNVLYIYCRFGTTPEDFTNS